MGACRLTSPAASLCDPHWQDVLSQGLFMAMTDITRAPEWVLGDSAPASSPPQARRRDAGRFRMAAQRCLA